MSNVSLTSAMSSNLLALKQTTSLMSMTQNRLATGLKVNSAIDNPSAYYTAVSLNNRAADLNSLLDNMGQAIQTVKAAVEGVETATKFLEQMQSITEQALAEPIALQTTTSSSAELEGYTKITADMSTADIQALITEGAKLVLDDDITLTEELKIDVDNVTLDGNGHKLSYTNTIDDSSFLTISGSNTKINNITFDYSSSMEIAGAVIFINSADNVEMTNFKINLAGVNSSGIGVVNATVKMSNFAITGEFASGVMVLDYSDIKMTNFEITAGSLYGVMALDNNDIKMTNFEIEVRGEEAIGVYAADSQIKLDSDAGIKASGTNSQKILGNGIIIDSSLSGAWGASASNGSVTEKNGVAAEWSKAFNNILNQYDMLIDDASYKGINLLKGEQLNVAFNEDKSSKLNILGKDIHSSALGLSTAEWQTVDDVNVAVADLKRCVATLRSLSSELGNNYSVVQSRQDFTESLINILTEGADKLTLADMNEESAIMLALQTRQQLAINSLSLASQSAQSVLRLFA